MDLSSRVPLYLMTKPNTVKLIVFTALFSLVFINVYRPYDSTHWLTGMSDIKYFLLSSAMVLMGMAVVAISRVIMYKFYGSKGRRMRLWKYLMWIAVEILSMSVTYTIFGMLMLDNDLSVIDKFKVSLWNTSLVLLLPYSVLWLYFSWDDKNKRLQRLSAVESMRSEGVQMADKVVMTNFYDSKGDIKFSVKLTDLIYIKGADNYITVYYQDGAKMSSVLIRTTMKQAETDLKPQGIIRCHKSYMVNRSHIKTLERKGDGFLVKMEAPLPLSVPITKSYVKDVYELFG